MLGDFCHWVIKSNAGFVLFSGTLKSGNLNGFLRSTASRRLPWCEEAKPQAVVTCRHFSWQVYSSSHLSPGTRHVSQPSDDSIPQLTPLPHFCSFPVAAPDTLKQKQAIRAVPNLNEFLTHKIQKENKTVVLSY